MKTCVLASGSKGNSTLIKTDSTNILIDLGTSSLYVEKKLKELGVLPSSIDAIIITHTHSDHISGLKVFTKKYQTKVYLTKSMLSELKQFMELSNYVIIDDDFMINDLGIKIFKTSHDTSDANGYVISKENKSVVYVTDTGYINEKYVDLLKNKCVYIFESNHDVEMLMNGKYPYQIKQRILGDKGHLSNKDSSYYLSKLIGNNTEFIVLAHISQDNNTPELALSTVRDRLSQKEGKIPNIIVATQNDKTQLIEV